MHANPLKTLRTRPASAFLHLRVASGSSGPRKWRRRRTEPRNGARARALAGGKAGPVRRGCGRQGPKARPRGLERCTSPKDAAKAPSARPGPQAALGRTPGHPGQPPPPQAPEVGPASQVSPRFGPANPGGGEGQVRQGKAAKGETRGTARHGTHGDALSPPGWRQCW
jgi:hypothetical protein